MNFSEHQLKILHGMLKTIEDFRKGKLQYSDLVYDLEGALDAGEFKDKHLIKQWYDYWTPIEILYATKGNSLTIEDANHDISDMELFLRSKICPHLAHILRETEI